MTKLGDFDIWFKVCKCGFDNAKGTKRSSGKCWRCGSKLARDYSDRALKKHEFTPEEFKRQYYGEPKVSSDNQEH